MNRGSDWNMCGALDGGLWALVLPLLRRNLVKASYHHKREKRCDKKHESIPKEGKLHIKGYVMNTEIFYNTGKKKKTHQTIEADENLKGVEPVTLTPERC